VRKIKNIPSDFEFPNYSDTLIQREERENPELYRKKEILSEIDGSYYLISMVQNIGDFKRLQDDILEGLIPAFIILALFIVLFNFFLSGYFFKPFNKILKQMKDYRVGKGMAIPNIKTDTKEFSTMQELFQNMIKRIEKEYKVLKEYTENIAHEIQTPLTVIRNKTENLISNDSIMQSEAASVKRIYDQVNHLSKLGSALNLLTKVEHGEFNNSVRLMTKNIIERNVESVSELADLKGIKFDLNLSEDHYLNIDPILFDIILNNLIKNSLNYGTDEGPIKIQTDETLFKISNHGPALKFSDERIYSRFHKENGVDSSLGIGLAIVHKICERNYMKIEYDYQEGVHTFKILKDVDTDS
jgi:signal transduction histidine kinase